MKNVLYIAPHMSVKGGISTVIKGYSTSNLAIGNNLIFIGSHIDGIKFKKVLQLIIAIIKLLYISAVFNIKVVHIHSGDIVSVKRKYIFFSICKMFNLPVVNHIHGSSVFDQFKNASKSWQRRFERLCERELPQFVARAGL